MFLFRDHFQQKQIGHPHRTYGVSVSMPSACTAWWLHESEARWKWSHNWAEDKRPSMLGTSLGDSNVFFLVEKTTFFRWDNIKHRLVNNTSRWNAEGSLPEYVAWICFFVSRPFPISFQQEQVGSFHIEPTEFLSFECLQHSCMVAKQGENGARHNWAEDKRLRGKFLGQSQIPDFEMRCRLLVVEKTTDNPPFLSV